MRPRHVLLCLIAVVAMFTAPECGSAADDRSALTKLIATGRIYGFLEILRNSGLPEAMFTDEELTLIVPIDTAFYDLPPEQYRQLLAPENRELAARYIRAHVVRGRLRVDELAARRVRTLDGTELDVERTSADGSVRINGCTVTLADLGGTPGMFHLIDGFLFKP